MATITGGLVKRIFYDRGTLPDTPKHQQRCLNQNRVEHIKNKTRVGLIIKRV